MSSTPAFAGQNHDYFDGDTALEGYYQPAQCDTAKGTVLIVHQWMGITDNEKMRAELLSKECYNAFAIDMYGKGIRPTSTEEAGTQATLYKSNADLARQRLTAALEEVKKIEGVDPTKIVTLGYCFGGTMALEQARSGADILAAISYHGGLGTPKQAQKQDLKAEIIVHHGAKDPLVPATEVSGFQQEMADADARLSFFQYPQAVHAFTQTGAGNDPSQGFAYNEEADKVSWQRTLQDLKRLFAL